MSELAPDGKCAAMMLRDPFEMICCILAAVKSAVCFLPINPEYPAEMVKHMLALADLVLTDEESTEIINGMEEHPPEINIDTQRPSQYKTCGFHTECGEDSPLYIYFTSGTTGVPKGIIGRNIGLYHFVCWEIRQFEIDENSVFSQFTPVCHDPFLRDIFTPLAAGACIAIPERREQLLDGNCLKQFVEEESISVIHATPSLFRLLLQSDSLTSGDFPALKYILLAGERLEGRLLSGWYDLYGERVGIVNLYGPTETTLAKLFYCVKPSDADRAAIPIGKPMKGAQVLLLDEHMQLCVAGQEGHIYIRTPYGSLGYCNDEKQNEERFIPNPFGDGNEEDKLFKTGDIGRILPDGNMEYIGRKDRQIKIRGFRVELNAVETALGSCPGITGCAVKAFSSEEGSLCIIGYYTGDREYEQGELSAHIGRLLPEYMCPSGFVRLEALPLTRNNKVDYDALEEPENYGEENYVEGETELEKEVEQVWCEVLCKNRFSVTCDFLAGGGNSLNIMLLLSKIRLKFGYELPVAKVFAGITIRELAGLIETFRASMSQNDMQDVEDMVIEHTGQDARYVRVHKGNGFINVMFTEEEPDDGLLDMIRENFESPLHPHYIRPLNEEAVVLPDEIDGNHEETASFLNLKTEYAADEIRREVKRLTAENRRMGERITSAEETAERALTAAQYVRKYIPENNGTLLRFHGLPDRKALNGAMKAVIESEPLLRCILWEGGYWREYSGVPDIEIPLLDLSGYEETCQDKIMDEIIIPEFYHAKYRTGGRLQWRVALIRFNCASHILCFSANHMIFDGLSRRIFEDEIRDFYDRYRRNGEVICKKAYTCFAYADDVQKLAGAHQELSEQISEFTLRSRKLKRMVRGRENMVWKFTVDMKPLLREHTGITADERMARMAFQVFLAIMRKHFELWDVPFVTISDGRRTGSCSCYDSIGEFIDYIPFIASGDGAEEYERYSQYLKDYESNGINVLESYGGAGQNSVSSRMKLMEYLRSIAIVYNYQHYAADMREERYESDGFREAGQMKLINFVVRPGTDTITFIITSPVHIDNPKQCAENICSTSGNESGEKR